MKIVKRLLRQPLYNNRIAALYFVYQFFSPRGGGSNRVRALE